MIVDDDAELGCALARSLEKLAHRVEHFECADDALKELRTGTLPDVILLDLNLPRIDGWEFRLIQRREPRWSDVPVIVLSGDTSAKAAAIDAAAFVLKPIDDHKLAALISTVHGEHSRQRAVLRSGEQERLSSLGALLGGLAHEINNPLAFVFGGIDILERQLPALAKLNVTSVAFDVATAMRALERVRQGAERVANVMQSASMFAFADLARIEALDVHNVLESCLQVTSNEIRHTAHLVRDYVDVPSVRGNAARVGQIFLNLLLNALHAVREAGGREHVIRVQTESADGMVIVSISDNACALDGSLIGEVPDSMTFAARGVPQRIDLAVSREVTQSMGGRIEVEALAPRGARFRVYLPAYERVSFPAPKPVSPAIVPPAIPSVLVIDDEPLLCELLSTMLADEYAVTAFSTPRAGLSALLEREFDVVLCDVMMPGLSGVELFEQIVEHRPTLAERFVFITGGAFTDRARLFLSQTGRPVLRKPCRRPELLDVIARVLLRTA